MTEPHDHLWCEWLGAWHDADEPKPKPSYEGWLEERLEAAEEDVRRMNYLEGEELSRGDALFRRNIPITRALVDAALAGEEKPKLGRDVCRYPDWEGGLIVGEHVWGQNGTCCVCGKEKP